MPRLTLKLDTSGTIDDSQLGALALAAGLDEYQDIENRNWEYFHEDMRTAFGQIDHEAAFIAALNAYGEGKADRKTENAIHDILSAGLYITYTQKCPALLMGAWHALEHADAFAEQLEAWTDARVEELNECLGDYGHMPEPYATQLAKDFEWSQEYTFNEYLNGDRSSQGVLGRAAENIFGAYSGASFDYDKKTDTVSLDIEDGHLRDYLRVNYGDLTADLDQWLRDNVESWDEDGAPYTPGAPLPPADLLEANFNADLNYRKQLAAEKRKRESEARKAEHERVNAYKQEQAAKQQAARRAKLEAMKR